MKDGERRGSWKKEEKIRHLLELKSLRKKNKKMRRDLETRDGEIS
jgi:hypothetical protein